MTRAARRRTDTSRLGSRSDMGKWAPGTALASALTCVVLAAGCVADANWNASGGDAVSSGGGPASSSAPTATSATQPMVVSLQTDRTLVGQPGVGVGVFTEYAAGGHWHIWWTCDTRLTSQSCAYRVTVSVASGTLSNVSGAALERSDEVTLQSPQQIVAQTVTTTGVDAINFDASAGTPIQLQVDLDPAPGSTYLFFVQNDQVNGGYMGDLTNPLILEPTAP